MVAALRACVVRDDLGRHLSDSLEKSDDATAWADAFALLAPLAATGSADHVQALRAVNLASRVPTVQTNG